jgi:hypothetical protein
MDFAVKQLAYSTLEMARVTAAAYRASRARAEGDRDLAESEFQKAEDFARSARLTSPDFLEAVVAGQRRD